MKKILWLFLLCPPIFGQTYFVTKQNVTLVSAAAVVTVQAPATNGAFVQFVSAWVDCSVACSFTLERNGNPATTTAGTISNLNSNQTTPKSKAFTSSNSGVGTVIGSYQIPAGGGIPIDLAGITFARNSPNGTGDNLTLRSNSISGVVNIVIKFTEQ